MKTKKLLIIAGGTGGHIFPALAVAEALQKKGVVIEWMGTVAGMEGKLIAHRYPIHFLPVKTFRGTSIAKKCVMPFRLIQSVLLAYCIIKKINPDQVLGMGGYASGPGGIAAWLLRKKLVIHEQNAHAGLTNRILSRFATTILQGFPNTFPVKTHAITVGNPVRTSIQQIAHTKDYYLKREVPWRILILGGSQGAQFINHLMVHFVNHHSARNTFLLWHQTGQRDFDWVKTAYTSLENFPHRVAPFIEKMEEAYAWADMVIARSGALTTSEIATVGLPSILIPYPYATDDHQYKNASFLEKNGAAVIFRETELTAEKLSACLQDRFFSQKHLQQMSIHAKLCARPNAVSEIMKVFL